MLVLVLLWLLLEVLDVRLSGGGSGSAGVLVMFRHCQDQVSFLSGFLGAESESKRKKKDLQARGRTIKKGQNSGSKQRQESKIAGKHRDSQAIKGRKERKSSTKYSRLNLSE